MLITEGSATIEVPEGKPTRKLPVFYNREMRPGRDVAVYIALKARPKRALDGMAGSGIRAIRLKREAGIPEIVANDINPEAAKLIRKNAASNKVKIKIINKELNSLLKEEEPFDYIDPFGSPINYVSAAARNAPKSAIITLTATDLGALFGRYPKRCKALYGALSSLTGPYRETAARILIRKVQEIAMEENKRLLPVFTHLTTHYLRVYFKVVDKLEMNHGSLYFCPQCLALSTSKIGCCGKTITAGPMWLGQLWDRELAAVFNLIPHIKEESSVEAIGYYSLDRIAKRFKLKGQRKISEIIEEIHGKGYRASRTHFHPQGIRADIPVKELKRIISS